MPTLAIISPIFILEGCLEAMNIIMQVYVFKEAKRSIFVVNGDGRTIHKLAQ